MSDPRMGRVDGVAPAPGAVRPSRGAAPAVPGFDRLLAERLGAPATSEPLRWSNHARDRLAQRGIPVTPDVQRRIEDAVGKAASKGSRDSLVMVDGNAFVVSVRNRTVITAVDPAAMRDHVFTNIDSAVLG